jgi:hypothetical protein
MERVVFYRERGALPYDPFAYGVAIALVEVPYLILQVWASCWCGRLPLGVYSKCFDHTAPIQPLAGTNAHFSTGQLSFRRSQAAEFLAAFLRR